MALQCCGPRLVACYKDKNKGSTVTVHDLRSCSLTFRAFYPDLDEVQNLAYVPDAFGASAAGEAARESDLESGLLILTELQKQKYLKKIHIVQLSQKQKAKKRVDRCDQVDALTF